MHSKKRFAAFAALFFISGTSALLYQVVWTKKLALLFGVTTYAVSTTLSVFMLGLALGSWHFGRIADRAARPLKVYVWLELGIGASAAVSLALLELMNLLIGNLGFSSASSLGFTLCRLAGSFVLLIVPTVLMGGTAPIMAKVMVTPGSNAGKGLGYLYAANTLGGVAGCLLSAFVLIPAAGLRATLLAGVAGNLAVALLAYVLLRRAPEAAPTQDAKADAAANESRPLDAAPGTYRAMQAAFFIAGLLGLALEVAWVRLLLLHVSSKAQEFAAILAVYLLGLALGSTIAGRLSGRYDASRGFAFFQLLTGIVVLASVFFWLPVWEDSTRELARWAFEKLPWFGGSAGAFKMAFSLTHAALLLLLPTFLMGCAFPFAGRFFAAEAATFGRKLGTAYMLNTAGSMLGPLACGFWWLPAYGIQDTLVLCGMGYLACGTFVFAVRAQLRLAWKAAGAVGMFALAWILIARPDGVLARVSRYGDAQVVYHREDLDGTVLVLDRRLPSGNYRQLLVGATSMIGNTFHCRRYTQLIGSLPMLMHPSPRKALVICLGSGMTVAAVASHPDVERIDCADLSEGVIHAARNYFSSENARVLEDPRVSVIVNDGRTHLLATRERYDVITLEPPPPNNAGVSNLYSREFYQLCKSRLAKGGMVAQWVPYLSLTLAQARSVVGTMQAVFPATTFWDLGDGEYCVVGHDDDGGVPYDRVSRALAAQSVQARLVPVGIRNAEDLLACFVMGPSNAASFAGRAPLVSDDLPGLGYDLSAYGFEALEMKAGKSQKQAAALETAGYAEDPSGFFTFPTEQAKLDFMQRLGPSKRAALMNNRALALTRIDRFKTETLLELARGFDAPVLLDPENAYYRDVNFRGVYQKALQRLVELFEQLGDAPEAARCRAQLEQLSGLTKRPSN